MAGGSNKESVEILWKTKEGQIVLKVHRRGTKTFLDIPP